jgi:hypothetical protein
VIGKHLATFNVFREPDGLYITIADASGVRDELGQSGAPLRLCAMNALRSALWQMDERAKSDTPQGGSA